MRVVAGRLGGRRLSSPGAGVRPTTDRVREALFSILGPIDGTRVLDLFAGSGALAVEALSRGAREAVLVEKDRRAAAVVARNLESLGLEGQARLVRGDAQAEVARLAEAGERFDLVFADPPYDRGAEALGPITGPLGELLAPGGRVVVESLRNDAPVLDLPMVHERHYGDTAIRIHAAPQ